MFKQCYSYSLLMDRTFSITLSNLRWLFIDKLDCSLLSQLFSLMRRLELLAVSGLLCRDYSPVSSYYFPVNTS